MGEHARGAPRPFHRPGWVYEKVDGFRMLAVKEGGRTGALLSRRGYDMGERFRAL